jgi:uncharacterized protein YgiM (DUF1202 family)|nr:MAG TPA: hypothetical protein [Caudoviricetes sp.]
MQHSSPFYVIIPLSSNKGGVILNDEYVSAYAIAKICGYNGSFNDFKIKYDQYYEEINEEISEEEPTLEKVSASTNPFRRHSPF